MVKPIFAALIQETLTLLGVSTPPRLNEMQVQTTALQTELTEQPQEERITGLHPEAWRHCEENVTRLQGVFAKGVTSDTPVGARLLALPRRDG